MRRKPAKEASSRSSPPIWTRSPGRLSTRTRSTSYGRPEDRVTERLRAVGLEPTPQFWEYANSDEGRAYQYIVVAGRDPGKLLQPIPLREKAVMEHARLTAELASAAAEVARL